MKNQMLIVFPKNNFVPQKINSNFTNQREKMIPRSIIQQPLILSRNFTYILFLFMVISK